MSKYPGQTEETLQKLRLDRCLDVETASALEELATQLQRVPELEEEIRNDNLLIARLEKNVEDALAVDIDVLTQRAEAAERERDKFRREWESALVRLDAAEAACASVTRSLTAAERLNSEILADALRVIRDPDVLAKVPKP